MCLWNYVGAAGSKKELERWAQFWAWRIFWCPYQQSKIQHKFDIQYSEYISLSTKETT